MIKIKKFLEELDKLGIKTVVQDGFKTDGREYNKTIHFPEVSEKGLFLLGKVTKDEFFLHQRIGMNGTDWQFGTFDTIDEDKIRFLKEQYFGMKEDIKKLSEFKKETQNN